MDDRTCGKRVGCDDRQQNEVFKDGLFKVSYFDLLTYHLILSYIMCMSEIITSHENVINQRDVRSRLNENGRIVIPAEIRSRMGIKPGDTLILTLEGDVLKIESQLARIRRIQESMRALIPGDRLLSDELIAERREEARREMEEGLG
jgi:AbrB family looped-hinge helix DNA binding protein